ncbi:winged helix-turn-helix domain-containing protein (plasmid) [Enterobacter mori]|uniref:winged helix-turn-helix domain-containing protein n=1 Tax=Enterobacter mori TaxID=539813 RepID=UPI003F62BB4D
MKFIINSTILFDVSEKTLSNDKNSIRLPNPAARLLLVLLENKDQQIGRNELLKRVWDDYGITASGNSLTNNLRTLKLGFSSLGVENIIESVPKVGVTFSPVQVELSEIASDYVTSQQAGMMPIEIKSKTIMHSIIALLVVLVSALVFFVINNFFEKKMTWVHFGEYKKCHLYHADKIASGDAENYLNSKLKTFLNERCQTETNVYYDNANTGKNITDVFLAVCGLNEKGSIDECENNINIEIN